MRCGVGFLPTVAATVALLAGCSSGPPGEQSQPGELSAGTAQITVNGNDLGQFQAVQCTRAGDLLTVTTGNDDSGSTTVISSAGGLVAKSVAIRNLGSFTGSFQAGLDGKADVTMAGTTYSITGQMQGFHTDKPSFRVPGTFDIRVAC